jgi:micrococcal nuclease
MRWTHLALVGVGLVVASCSAGPDAREPAPFAGEVVEVVEVVDGDTIIVTIEGRRETVRLIGINSPEAGECFAAEATAAAARAVRAGKIRLAVEVSERDRYGRLLRHVYTGRVLLNDRLVRGGYALALPVPPDLALAARLLEAEATARSTRTGLWAPAACGPAAPPGIVIVSVEPGSTIAGGSRQAEWITISNRSGGLVDLTGWSVRDASSAHRYRFPLGFELAPGDTVEIRTSCGNDHPDVLFWCADSPIWNDRGDLALILDAQGNIAAALRY